MFEGTIIAVPLDVQTTELSEELFDNVISMSGVAVYCLLVPPLLLRRREEIRVSLPFFTFDNLVTHALRPQESEVDPLVILFR